MMIQDPMFVPANPDGAVNEETCPHPWDAVHYVNEGFDVIHCGRCHKVLGIEPKEFDEEPTPEP